MSFQNRGVTPSGRKFNRGEAVLVEFTSHLLAGRISEISTSDAGESVVAVTADAGVLNTMGGGKSAALAELSAKTGIPVMDHVPATIYLDWGFHHQSTSQTRVGGAKPQLFCFADEEPTFATAGAPDAQKAPVVDEVTEAVPVDQGNDPGKTTAPLAPLPSEKKADDPRDLDHDGTVSRKEEKQFQREHPHGSEGKPK